MTRKVSLWTAMVLAVALGAAVAGIAVVATHGREGNDIARGAIADGGLWNHRGDTWGDGARGDRGVPAQHGMSVMYGERHDDGDVLPWILFGLAAGTAAGLLVAWRPWKVVPGTTGASGGVQAASVAPAEHDAGVAETRVEASPGAVERPDTTQAAEDLSAITDEPTEGRQEPTKE